MNTQSRIESLLFIAGKPISVRKLAELTAAKEAEVREAAEALMTETNAEHRGVHVMKVGESYQMVTAPAASGLAKAFVKSEQAADLTRPSLETLTIIAYRGPVTKVELEQIRGVNCSLILRNLLIKGLVEPKEDRGKKTTVYEITFDFLRFLGLNRVEELPDYEKLNSDENLRKLLELNRQPDANANA